MAHLGDALCRGLTYGAGGEGCLVGIMIPPQFLPISAIPYLHQTFSKLVGIEYHEIRQKVVEWDGGASYESTQKWLEEKAME
jgi:hypothetical protein